MLPELAAYREFFTIAVVMRLEANNPPPWPAPPVRKGDPGTGDQRAVSGNGESGHAVGGEATVVVGVDESGVLRHQAGGAEYHAQK
jgi:hypothetical protein